MEVTGPRARSVFDRARGRTENPIADPAGNARPHRRATASRSRSETRWFWDGSAKSGEQCPSKARSEWRPGQASVLEEASWSRPGRAVLAGEGWSGADHLVL